MNTATALSNITKTKNVINLQQVPIKGREHEMIQNSDASYVFSISDKSFIERFLIIGTVQGNYYTKGEALTNDSVKALHAILQKDGKLFVDTIIEVSISGRAKNNDYALLALAYAMAEGNDKTKRYAAKSLPLVARTGTHLFHFVKFVTGFRGWGKVLKGAVIGWYTGKSDNDLAYQMVKYQSRDGWGHRDILRLTHQNVSDNPVRNNLFKWTVRGLEALEKDAVIPDIIYAFEKAKTASKGDLVKLITDYHMSHEMLPTEAKNIPEVWEALLPSMGATALIRNLNKMTAVGLLKPLSNFTKDVYAKLNDEEFLKRGKVHPIQMLIALKQYSQGKGDKGSLIWTPNQAIVKGLDEGFYHSFKTVEPSGKNYLLGIDISSSMMGSKCIGAETISAAEAAMVMAMVTVRKEPWCQVMGFNHQFVDLKISAADTLESSMKKAYSQGFGSTNCSMPTQYARQQKLDVDTFVIYTDNETNYKDIHPSQSLALYRKEMNKPNTKNIVVGMSVNRFTIADSKDVNSLDIVGFDSNTPSVISEFTKINVG